MARHRGRDCGVTCVHGSTDDNCLLCRAEALDLRSWQAWQEVHQPFELDWWRTAFDQGHFERAGFIRECDQIKDFIRPRGRVLDIGCGPRPLFAPCCVIDPLANQYQKLVPARWWKKVIWFAQPVTTS